MVNGYTIGTSALEQSFADSESAILAQGFNEEIATHVHPFAPKALVVKGEMWLMAGGLSHHLTPRGTFELDREVPHAERYGAVGVTY